MRTIAMIAGLAIAVAAVPAASQAACQKRTNGTVIGASAAPCWAAPSPVAATGPKAR